MKYYLLKLWKHFNENASGVSLIIEIIRIIIKLFV